MSKTAICMLVLALAAAQVNAGTKAVASPFRHLTFSYDDAVWTYAESVLTMRGTDILLAINELPHLGLASTAEQVLDTFESDELLRPGVSQAISKKLDAVVNPVGWSCRSYERSRGGKTISLGKDCSVVGTDHVDFLSIQVPGDHIDKSAAVRLNKVLASIKHT